MTALSLSCSLFEVSGFDYAQPPMKQEAEPPMEQKAELPMEQDSGVVEVTCLMLWNVYQAGNKSAIIVAICNNKYSFRIKIGTIKKARIKILA